MKVKESQKIDESTKKYNNLTVKTDHQTTFDSRWAQIKIQGKNIPSRSNHIAAIFDTKYYIHGGYDADKGVLSDFNVIDLAEDSQIFEWKKLNNSIDGKPIRLKSHTAVVHKTSLILFGGQLHTNQSSNAVYVYDFVDNTWKAPKVSGVKVPNVDSHAVASNGQKMYVIGGYIPQRAEYMKNIYCLDLQKYQWKQIYEGNSQANEPQARSNFSAVYDNDNLLIFGGTNGKNTMNDFWKFSLSSFKWEQIKAQNPPEPRRGHSMISFQGSVFLFGGIQDITKQKNDIYIYQSKNNTWNKIHTSTNSIYQCSPTLKNSGVKKASSKSPDKIQLHKVSPQKNSEKGSDIMKKIINQNKQKRFLQKKKQLLRQFSDKPSQFSNVRSHSPTTQSMLKTLQSIGNQQVSKKELKQEIIYDESHRYIIGKKPCARDGQSVCIRDSKMYIFGGDRHLMAFNDLYSFDLDKGLKSLELYRS